MYSEVRELVNFLARYLLGRQPRRPTGIFTAELGNFLVTHFAECGWDVNNPKLGEKERIVYIQCVREGTTKFIETAAEESGLNYQEVLSLLPQNLRIYANPGEVFMRANDAGMDIPIWTGDVDADEEYQPNPEHIVRSAASLAEENSNMGAAGRPVLIGRKPIPTNDKTVLELINGCYVPLILEEYDDNSNLHHPQQIYRYRYVFKPHSSQTFTGLEFSQTRFGSSKPRPDLQTMLNIKQLAQSQKQQNSAASETSSSPTPPTPQSSINGYHHHHHQQQQHEHAYYQMY